MQNFGSGKRCSGSVTARAHRGRHLARPWAAAVCLLSLCTAAAYAAAADQTDATNDDAPLQDVVITGSRIPVPANASSTSPVQVVSSQDFQLSGTTDTINMIRTLPQNSINSSGVDFGNNTNPLTAAGGTATADLRGLGPQRTLVLVDGKRLGPGDPNTANPNPAPDLDQIPAALIERVDIVTGGASAVYGSDAVAGVINFIMKKDFQGIEVDGQYGLDQHDNHETWAQNLESGAGFTPTTGGVTDGGTGDLSVIGGTNFNDNAGNITAYITYHHQNPVAASSRDFGNCELVTNSWWTGSGPANGYTCIGSTNSNYFQPAGSTNAYSVVGNQLLPWPQTGSNPPADYNSSSSEYLQRQDLRSNAGFLSHLDVTDWAKPYLDFSFMNDRTTEAVAPSGLFEGANPYTADNNYLVNCSNPLLSAQEQSILCPTPGQTQADVDIGRRNVEGGDRLSFYEHENYRVVGGSQGDFADAWSYDAYGQYAYTYFYNDNQNYLNLNSIDNALQVTGTAAHPTCVSGGTCVPYDIWSTGAVTPEQLAYLYSDGTAVGRNWEEVAHADVTGDLGQYGIRLPWAKDGVGVNVGVEHRFEALQFQPDAEELSGNLSGFVGASVPIDASYDVSEAFTEIRVPLAQGRAGIHNLTFDTGYRYSDYSTAGSTGTYKFEVQYAPVTDFTLRYSFDRAIRAPNLIELYNPASYGSQSAVGTDPCAPTLVNGVLNPATASLAQCERTGVTAAQYGNGGTTNSIPQCVADQCGQVTSGNTALKPETADTYSLGITLTPSMLPNFNGSVDYYHIALSNEIGVVSSAYLFNQCLLYGTQADCSQVVRNYATGALSGASVASGGYILQSSANTGAALVSGIDVQANYRLPLRGWGSLTANLNGSWLQHEESTPYQGAHTYDCAGLYGAICQTVNPTWRHNLRVNWQTPWAKLLISTNWRFIGETALDNNSSDPSLHFAEEGEYDVVNAHIPRYNYLDLSALWPIGYVELTGGINNIFDKDPPTVAQEISGSTPNSYPTYDYLGRTIYLAVKAKF